MSSVIIKATDDQLSQMEAYYYSYSLNKQIPYTGFAVEKDGTTTTAYTSGKVMFRGMNAVVEADRRGEAQDKQAKPARATSSLSKDISQLSALGSDEVGSGSCFGPLTACVAYVERDQLVELRKLGIRDSKELKGNQIIRLADTLKKTIPYKLSVLSPEKYSGIQLKYNAVRMKVALHDQVIHLLLKKIEPKKPGVILIDWFTPGVNSRKYARLEKNQLWERLHFVTRGERYHLVATAAFITSRASFLEELHKVSAEAGTTLPSGVETKSDQVVAKLLEKGGMPMLKKYARPHFANMEKALKPLKK